MKNKVRLSIDDEIGEYGLTQKQLMSPPSRFRPVVSQRNSGELRSIHRNSDMEPMQNTSIIHTHQAAYTAGGRQPDTEVDNSHYYTKSASMAASQKNRITFSGSPSMPNEHFRHENYPNNNPRSEHRLKTAGGSNSKLKKKSSYSNMGKNFNKFQSSQNYIHARDSQGQSEVESKRSALQQVVQDLEKHNKSIMKETKEKVSDFQAYIEQLLKANKGMERNLDEYQKYIEQLEIQKQEILDQQKQREKQLENAVRQKMTFQKQLSNASMSVENNLRQQIQFIQAKVKDLQFDLTSKQNLIKLLEESVSQKEETIKKMAQFNNDMCMQILNLKQSGVETMSTDNNSSHKSEANLLETLQRKINTLQSQNMNLCRQKKDLEYLLHNLANEDEKIVATIQRQASFITTLEQKLEVLHTFKSSYERKMMISKNNNAQIVQFQSESNGPGKGGIIIKNKKSHKQSVIRQSSEQDFDQEATFEKRLDEVSEIYAKGNHVGENIFQDEIQESNYIIMKKIDSLLKNIATKLSLVKTQKVRNLIESMKNSLKKMYSPSEQDRSLRKSGHHNQKDFNFLDLIEGDNQSGQRNKSNNVSILKRQNEEVLSKISRIKKKLQEHRSDMQPKLMKNLSQKSPKNSNSRLEQNVNSYDFQNLQSRLSQKHHTRSQQKQYFYQRAYME